MSDTKLDPNQKRRLKKKNMLRKKKKQQKGQQSREQPKKQLKKQLKKQSKEQLKKQLKKPKKTKNSDLQGWYKPVLDSNIGIDGLKRIFVSKKPIIYYVDNFVANSENGFLISNAEKNMDHAMISTKTGKGKISKSRSNSVYWFKTYHSELQGLIDRIQELIQCDQKYFERFQIINYTKNQKFDNHYDAYDKKTINGKVNTVEYGNRLITVLMYLTTIEVKNGGYTKFPILNAKIQCVRNRCVVFYDCLPNKSDIYDSRTLHSGSVVKKGEKWAVNVWIREKKIKYN